MYQCGSKTMCCYQLCDFFIFMRFTFLRPVITSSHVFLSLLLFLLIAWFSYIQLLLPYKSLAHTSFVLSLAHNILFLLYSVFLTVPICSIIHAHKHYTSSVACFFLFLYHHCKTFTGKTHVLLLCSISYHTPESYIPFITFYSNY